MKFQVFFVLITEMYKLREFPSRRSFIPIRRERGISGITRDLGFLISIRTISSLAGNGNESFRDCLFPAHLWLISM